MDLSNKDTRNMTISMPMHYRQGRGKMNDLPVTAGYYSSVVLLLGTVNGLNRLGNEWIRNWSVLGLNVHFEIFNGECSETEIKRIKQEAERQRVGVIVGLGGGKLLDTAKSVAYRLRLPIVIVPTVASSDAPCSALSVIYDDNGRVEKLETHPHNPEVVLVDTDIILHAPLRYLAAGMGDALATGPEALACRQGGGKTILGDYPTQLGTAAAVACDRILEHEGIQAYEDAKCHILSSSFEAIVEANTLLSGIGFESGGLAAAHSLHNGLTELAECHHLLHGEKVGFCTAVQAVLFGQSEEANRFLKFCKPIGLPISLSGLGLVGDREEVLVKLKIVAERTLWPEESIHQSGKRFIMSEIVQAFLETDRISRGLFQK
jgi:glycerol dehydrogenase